MTENKKKVGGGGTRMVSPPRDGDEFIGACHLKEKQMKLTGTQ